MRWVWFGMCLLSYVNNMYVCTESYVIVSNIGFDPDYEVIKKTRPASNKTPDERMTYLVVIIVQEGNNNQFRVCLMSQNRVVLENKTIFQTRNQSHVYLVLLVLVLVLVLDHA